VGTAASTHRTPVVVWFHVTLRMGHGIASVSGVADTLVSHLDELDAGLLATQRGCLRWRARPAVAVRAAAASFDGLLPGVGRAVGSTSSVPHIPVAVAASFSAHATGKVQCAYDRHEEEHVYKDSCDKCPNGEKGCQYKWSKEKDPEGIRSDCVWYDGKCISRDLGKGRRIGAHKFYWGPSRPFPNGDSMTYGQRIQITGPPKPEKGNDMKEDGLKNTGKGETADEGDKDPWVSAYFDGNRDTVNVKSLNDNPPDPGLEPKSKEADIAKSEIGILEDQRMINTILAQAGMNIAQPCDRNGRIQTTDDFTYCNNEDACVTALPADFAKDTGDFCFRPPVAGFPAELQTPPGQDVCAANAGQPWCVPVDVLKKYRERIEIRCSASGENVRDEVGNYTGCWWLKKMVHSDIQRLPGNIKSNIQHSNMFVKPGSGQSGITEEQAEEWIAKGVMKEERLNEFLAPPEKLTAAEA